MKAFTTFFVQVCIVSSAQAGYLLRHSDPPIGSLGYIAWTADGLPIEDHAHSVSLLTDPNGRLSTCHDMGCFFIAADATYHDINVADPLLTEVLLQSWVGLVEEDHLTAGELAGSLDPTWAMDMINWPAEDGLPAVHPSKAGNGVQIYVLDTGVDLSNTEFHFQQLGFKDHACINCPAETALQDPHGHGTAVIGLIKGNTVGMAAASTVIPIALGTLEQLYQHSPSPSFSVMTFVKAMSYISSLVVANRKHVLNLSLQFDGIYPSVDNALLELTSDAKKVHVVVAAGNHGGDYCSTVTGHSPSHTNLANRIIKVGGINRQLNVMDFVSPRGKDFRSNYGPCVDVYAPSVNITSCAKGCSPLADRFSGTSMATAMVTALLASYLSTVSQTEYTGEIGPTVATYKDLFLQGYTLEDEINTLPGNSNNNLLTIVQPTMSREFMTSTSCSGSAGGCALFPLGITYDIRKQGSAFFMEFQRGTENVLVHGIILAGTSYRIQVEEDVTIDNGMMVLDITSPNMEYIGENLLGKYHGVSFNLGLRL